MAVTPVPVQVPTQRPLDPSLTEARPITFHLTLVCLLCHKIIISKHREEEVDEEEETLVKVNADKGVIESYKMAGEFHFVWYVFLLNPVTEFRKGSAENGLSFT